MMRLQNASSIGAGALTKDAQNSKAILRNVNWDFYQRSVFSPEEMRPFKCSAHHWCPATFVPEIPFTLIEVLSLPNAVVYDPFAGVGTTYFQALLLNRKPLATEICKVSVEFMRALFRLFDPTIDLNKIKEKVQIIVAAYKYDTDYTSSEDKQISVDKLRPWYSSNTLNQLAFLFVEQARCRDESVRAAMWTSTSAILQSVSSQDRGWGCIADNVLPKEDKIKDKDALTSFNRHINRLLKDICEYLKYTQPGYDELYRDLSQQQTIFHNDVRECREILESSVDLVVTSPPYPNMTDYVNSQRLSYYFTGFDMANDWRLEIGARSRRQRKDALALYSEDMQHANEAIAKKLKRGGYACYVMPVFSADNDNSKNRRQIVQKIMSRLEDLDLIKEDEFERILPAIRRAHNAKWATLERERIYLFRKA
jgi:DNA modification methylase